MLKIVMFIAVVGHFLCGVTDCLLGYSKKGKLNLKDINDPKKMSDMFADMPLSFPLASILLGTFAITLFSFGYLELSDWMSGFSKAASTIMYVSGVFYLVPIVTHHVFCGTVEWMYIKLKRTDEARNIVLDFQKKTIATMAIGYLGLVVFMITLFIMIVTGQTSLPKWACIFNTLIVMIALLPVKFPAKGNIAGAVMFLGLFFLI